MQKVISLNQSIRKFSIRNSTTTFANPVLHKLTIKELCHRERLTNFAQKRQIVHILEPVIVVHHHQLVTLHNLAHLRANASLIVLHFFQWLQVALTVIFWVANLPRGTAHQQIWLIAMSHKTSAHHGCRQVTNRQGISRRIGTPIELLACSVI